MAEDSLFSLSKSAFLLPQQGEEGDGLFLSRLDWTVGMHRVFLALLGRSEAWSGASFSACRVPVRHVRELAQVTQKSIYEEMAKATARLVREPIEFGGSGEQDYEAYPIFSACKYKSQRGIIEAKFNEDARPYLLQLRDHFTQYRLRQAIPLSTPYAIRTYEIAKMIERPGERRSRQIPVGRFRKMFSLEDKYDRHRDMRRRVIDPAVQQVSCPASQREDRRRRPLQRRAGWANARRPPVDRRIDGFGAGNRFRARRRRPFAPTRPCLPGEKPARGVVRGSLAGGSGRRARRGPEPSKKERVHRGPLPLLLGGGDADDQSDPPGTGRWRWGRVASEEQARHENAIGGPTERAADS